MTREQRCWVHKTANVLNKLPNSLHAKAKRALQEIWMAETKNDALVASFFGCQYDYTTHTHKRRPARLPTCLDQLYCPYHSISFYFPHVHSGFEEFWHRSV